MQRRPRRNSTLRIIGIACVLSLSAGRIANGQSVVRNLGSSKAWLLDNTLVDLTSETFVGEDLNGDGDTQDDVMQLEDLSTQEVTNLGLATVGVSLFFPYSCPRVLVLSVPEAPQGEDLNGDDDLEDEVFHVVDLSTREVTNLMLAGSRSGYTQNGPRFWVSEPMEGIDLNGDGDTEDEVIHDHDLSTGATTNLGISGEVRLSAGGDSEVLRVPEGANGVDFNGDGDHEDTVLHVHHGSTGEIRNLGLVNKRDGKRLFRLSPSGKHVIFSVPEAEQSMDLNGDGDHEDSVIHVHTFSSGITENLRLVYGDGSGYTSSDWIVLVVPEQAQGQDLNGDGDIDDDVVHVHRFSTAQTRNLRLPLFNNNLRVSRQWLWFLVWEGSQNVDLNSDGDSEDRIFFVHDLSTSESRNTGLPLGMGRLVAEDNLVVRISERQKGEDLNGDGDVEDSVLHFYHLASGTLTNLRIAGRYNTNFWGSDFRGSDAVALRVDEPTQGEDLNGDGDTGDAVLFLFFPTTHETKNLGLHGGVLESSGDVLIISVSETRQRSDLNGDGDTDDSVLHLHDISTGQTTNLELAARRISVSSDRWLVLSVAEVKQGADLNGDGDTADDVIHLFDHSTGEITNTGVANVEVRSFVSDRWLLIWADVLLVHDAFTGMTYNLGLYRSTPAPGGGPIPEAGYGWPAPFFSVSGGRTLIRVPEREQGSDLNGDGDREDSIWHLLDLGATERLVRFRRGDCNEDGDVDVADVGRTLNWLFGDGEIPSCTKSADANDSGTVDLTDAVYVLNFLFAGGPPPDAPFPECGPDPTSDDLTCEYFEACQ